MTALQLPPLAKALNTINLQIDISNPELSSELQTLYLAAYYSSPLQYLLCCQATHTW